MVRYIVRNLAPRKNRHDSTKSSCSTRPVLGTTRLLRSRLDLVIIMIATITTANAAVGPLPGFNNDASTMRYAAFSVMESTSDVDVVLGSVRKLSEPLFTGTEAWEHDINNGYSSVLYDGADTFGLGRYRVYYSAGDPSFGGSIPGESSGSATLYATSNDGLAFEKPNLGRYVFNNSTDNNILFDGTTAVAVYDDAAHERNASARFKAWGNLPGPAELLGSAGLLQYTAQLGGSAVSADGLNFTDYRRLQNPSSSATVKDTWRFDAQASMYYDPRTERYTGTMRAFRPCASCGECPIWWQPHGGCQEHVGSSRSPTECNRTVRAIGAAESEGGNFAEAQWGPSVEVHADHSDPTHQYYSQVSWPFYNIYLAITMVFSVVDPPNVFGRGKVDCELAWSQDGYSYQRVAPGVEFIPHGPATAPGADDNASFGFGGGCAVIHSAHAPEFGAGLRLACVLCERPSNQA